MRLSVDTLRRVVKRDLAIQFVPQRLTSYGGLELLHRYVRRITCRPACAQRVRDSAGITAAPTRRGG